jgi:hypothetical protein
VNTTQRIDHSTLKRVRKYGKMGESFDQALSRMLDKIEQEEESPV